MALEKPIIPTFSLAERDRGDTVAIEAGGARRLGRRELAFVSVQGYFRASPRGAQKMWMTLE